MMECKLDRGSWKFQQAIVGNGTPGKHQDYQMEYKFKESLKTIDM